MFHPTQNHRDRGGLSHLKISAPEIVAIVGGAVLSIGLLGAIMLFNGGGRLGGISAVTAPSATTAPASAPQLSQPQAPAARMASPTSRTAAPTPPKAMPAAAAAKPSPESTSTLPVPRPRPARAMAPAPPPAKAAQRPAPTAPQKAAPKIVTSTKAPSIKAKPNTSRHSAPARAAAETASAPARIVKPAPPLQRAQSPAAATKPTSTIAPAPSKAATGKTVQAGATAATTTTPAPTGPVRIVIDYEAAAPGMSDMADQLARKLREKGYKPVEIRPVQFIVSANQVRFFFDQDHDAAKRIEGIVAKVKDPGGAERHFAVTEFAHLKQPPPDNLVEVWLRSW